MSERCELCLYWDASVSSGLGVRETGRCRVDPPRPDYRTHVAVWPFTEDVDWCGRFDPDPGRNIENMEATE